MMKTPTYEATEFESLNELLDEWKDSDETTNENLGLEGAMNMVTENTPVSTTGSGESVNDIVNLREAQLFI